MRVIQWHAIRESTFSPVDTVYCVASPVDAVYCVASPVDTVYCVASPVDAVYCVAMLKAFDGVIDSTGTF
jgi:hypothetical protein